MKEGHVMIKELIHQEVITNMHRMKQPQNITKQKLPEWKGEIVQQELETLIPHLQHENKARSKRK